jgi:spoIIIJ-associated protein
MDERHRQSMTVSAKTVDEAVAEAERELGVSREHLDITVITEGTKGFLGMRAENARILAVVMSAPPAATPREATRHEKAHAPDAVAVAEATAEAIDEEYEEEEGEPVEPGVRAQQRQETATVAQEILETLLRQMDISSRVSVRTVGNPIILDVETESGGPPR